MTSKVLLAIYVFLISPSVLGTPSNLNLKWNNFTRKFQLSWDYPLILSRSLESFHVTIIDEKGNKEERGSPNNILELNLEDFVLYSISVKGKNKDFSEESTINVKIFPPLQDLNKDFPIIEKCSNSSCTLRVFDSHNEKSLKKYNAINSEIDKKNLNCSSNEVALDKEYYRWINFGGGAGLIFNLNNKTFCFSTRTLLHSQYSIPARIMITILHLMIYMLLFLCFYVFYRYCKTYNLMEEKREEDTLLMKDVPSTNSKLIDNEHLKEYVKTCMKNNSREMKIVMQHQEMENVGNSSLCSNNDPAKRNEASYCKFFDILVENAPQKTDIREFWKMVYEKNISTIVSIKDLKEDEENNYWPKQFANFQFEEISVDNKATKFFKDHISRKFEVKLANQIKVVNHFQHFHIKKEEIIYNFQDVILIFERILRILDNSSSTLLQRNADCDFSSLIIFCAAALKMAQIEGKVDFLKLFFDIKETNAKTLLTVEEYVFGHLFVLEVLQSKKHAIEINGEFEISLNRFLNDLSFNDFVKELDEMKELQKLIDDSKFVNNENGCLALNRIYFTGCQPPNNLHEKFWSFVLNSDVYLIISLNEIEERATDVTIFWPNEESQIKEFGETSINCLKTQDNHYLQTSKLKISNKNKVKIIDLISMKQWRAKKQKPFYVQSLLYTWKEMIDNVSFKSGKDILLICYDGFTACGLFLSLNFLLEKIISERIFDVFSAIRRARQYDENFVRDFAQTEILCKLALEYVYKFEDANYSYSLDDEKYKTIIFE